MDNQSLLVRVVAAGLPLLVVALVFGAVGYAITDPETTPIPPLAPAEAAAPATQGELTVVNGNQLTVVTATGESKTFTLAQDAPVELLDPIELAEVRVGDWLNGGAIPHPDTLLALVSLILLPEPVTP